MEQKKKGGFLYRLTREPALVLGVVTTGLALAVLFGLQVTAEQTAGVGVFLGALMALVRFLTTPNAEVLAQVKPNGQTVAGKASTAKTGEPLVAYVGGNAETVLEVPVDPDAP